MISASYPSRSTMTAGSWGEGRWRLPHARQRGGPRHLCCITDPLQHPRRPSLEGQSRHSTISQPYFPIL